MFTDAMGMLGQDVFPCLRAQGTSFHTKTHIWDSNLCGVHGFLSRISRSNPDIVWDLETDEEIHEAHSTTGAADLML